jgi:hypothetical protein
MDARRRIAADCPLEQRIATLEAALSACVGDLIWCSGSPDFCEGGQARIGWLKGPTQSIEQARAALAGEKEEK